MRSKISVFPLGILMVLLSMAFSPVYAGDTTVTDCTNFTGAGTISQAVTDANSGGGTISVTCIGTIIFDDTLTITTDVVLNNDSGGEVIFDGTGHDNRFFSVDSGASLALDGFTLQNSNGGAIYADGTLTVSNSTFTGNSVDSYGGAIFSFDGTVTITDSTFTDNSADAGGAISNSGTVTISNSTFTGNSARGVGGAIFSFDGTLTISNSTFTDNLATAGGAIYNDSGDIVSSQDTHYENNTCTGDITDDSGNTATNARGCPSATPATDDDTGDATISTCDLATLQSAVYIANSGGGTISITCTGTIIFEDKLIIADNVVLNNDSGGEVIFDETGDDNGFFIVYSNASLALNGFTLQNGNSTYAGGAIDNLGALTVTNSTFIDNSADSFGGAINNNFGTLTVTNSTFIGNSAKWGGAIYNDFGSTATITTSTFTYNSANSDGGAIYNDRGTVSSQDTHYENNTCSGGITDNGGNTATNATGCPVTPSVTDDTGGETVSTCDFATLQSAVDIANNDDRAISITCTGTIIFEDELTIGGSVVINNDSGGEVIFDETGDDNRFFFLYRGASLTLNGFTLQNGNGNNGGAIQNNGTLTITNSTFIGNSTSFSGGAIYNDGTLTVSNSTFTGNSTDFYGGAIRNEGTLTITNSTFTDNLGDEGGAISNARTLTISNSTFTGNWANSDGGAIFNSDYATASSQDTHYENNTCSGDIIDNSGNTVVNAPGCPGN